MSVRVLIAGVGNIFLGDDAFGVEVVRRLRQRSVSPQARIIDFGIRGIDLAFAMLDNYEGIILVDTVSRGGEPGMLYLLEPDLDNMVDSHLEQSAVEAHRLDPLNVLHLVRSLGGPKPVVRIVGCEAATLDPVEQGQAILSEPVEAAVERAILLIEAVLQNMLSGVLSDGERLVKING